MQVWGLPDCGPLEGPCLQPWTACNPKRRTVDHCVLLSMDGTDVRTGDPCTEKGLMAQTEVAFNNIRGFCLLWCHASAWCRGGAPSERMQFLQQKLKWPAGKASACVFLMTITGIWQQRYGQDVVAVMQGVDRCARCLSVYRKRPLALPQLAEIEIQHCAWAADLCNPTGMRHQDSMRYG